MFRHIVVCALAALISAEVYLDERFKDGGKKNREYFELICEISWKLDILISKVSSR